jgi:hypothetical protein
MRVDHETFRGPKESHRCMKSEKPRVIEVDEGKFWGQNDESDSSR